MKSFKRKLIYSAIIITSLIFLKTISSQTQKKVQDSLNKVQLAEKVKSEFIDAWEGYKKYAWGHDALKPLSKSYKDWYGVSEYDPN